MPRRDNISDINTIISLAYQLFENDDHKVSSWLTDPNHIFFGLSPLKMAMGGRGDTVIEKLKEWLGNEDTD